MCGASRRDATDPKRILFRFVRYIRIDDTDLEDPCWIWTGGRLRKRRGIYGKFWLLGRNVSAHRVMLWLKTGEWGKEGCHAPHCSSTLCVNPSHLRWGTREENEADKKAKAAVAVGAELSKEDLEEVRQAIADLRTGRRRDGETD